MKLEPGKYYRTGDGRKAFVAGIRSDALRGAWDVVGWIEGIDGSRSWTRDGEYGQPGCANIYDLISEWREPVSLDVVVHVYRWDTGAITSDTCHSEWPDSKRLIARKNVTIVEGEGMA